MSAYLVVSISVHDADLYKEYAAQVPPFIAKHGGEYCVRGGATELLDGDWNPERLVVVRFPSRQKAMDFIEDPGYAPVAAIRHRAATTNMIVAEGFDGP